MTLSSFSLRKLRQRDLALIIIVLTVLLSLLWYFYLYRPAQARITELDLTIETLNADIRTGEIARDSIEALEADIAELQEQRRAFLAELPLASEVSNLIDQLRVGAEAAGVDFSSVSQGGPSNEEIESVRSIGFSVATQGSYAQTMSFLNLLESLRRFTKIRQVSLSVSDNGIEDPGLSATYDFTVYVYTGSDPGDVTQ